MRKSSPMLGELVCKQSRPERRSANNRAYSIAREAYRFFYPLITMDITRKQCTNMEAGKKPGFGPMNIFTHMRAYPDANFKSVVRPNFDTLYSIAWLDLTEEPMVISVPDTSNRYYLLPMLDMWSDVFASPGWRTSGTTAKHFVVAPQSWTGKLPEQTERIAAPTSCVWIIGRTKTDGPADYAAVHKIQDGFTVTPLSQWGKKPAAVPAKIDPAVDMTTPPLEQVNKMNAASYFAYAAELMKLYPPHITDWSIISRLQRIGIEPGKSFDASKLDPTIKHAVDRGIVDELKSMVDLLPTMGPPGQRLADEYRHNGCVRQLLFEARHGSDGWFGRQSTRRCSLPNELHRCRLESRISMANTGSTAPSWMTQSARHEPSRAITSVCGSNPTSFAARQAGSLQPLMLITLVGP